MSSSKVAIVLMCVLLASVCSASPMFKSQRLSRHPHRVLSMEEAKHRMGLQQERIMLGRPVIDHFRNPTAWRRAAPAFVATSDTNSVFVNGSIIDLGFYYTELQIGSQQNTFALDIDTGSSTLTVPGAGCNGCGPVPEYSSASSSNSHQILCTDSACNCGQQGKNCCSTTNSSLCGFSIQYGEGEVAGYLVNDRACFDDHCGTAAIASIEQSKDFGPKTTGILGLGYKALDCTPTCETPLFEQLVQEGIYKDIFALCLTEKGGVLDLGFYDDSKVGGSIQWSPITLEAWYIIPMVDTLVGGTSIGVPASDYAHSDADRRIGSFVDSGATEVIQSPLIFNATRKIFESNYANLPGITGSNNIFDGGCAPSYSGYPTITFVLNDASGNPTVKLDMAPQYYMLDFSAQAGQTCFQYGIAPNEEIGVVLGDVFIQSHYVIFDREQTRLGFAPLAHCV